jgi:hypothetical protein
LVLQKRWANGAADDTADLSIDGDTAGDGFATATAPAGGNGLAIDKASTVLLSGETVDLAEALGAGNTGSYASQISCDRPGLTADGDGRGGSFQVPATPEAVTCTITNTRFTAPGETPIFQPAQPAPGPATASEPPPPASGLHPVIAHTGGPIGDILTSALGLLTIGSTLMLITRRRRTRTGPI